MLILVISMRLIVNPLISYVNGFASSLRRNMGWGRDLEHPGSVACENSSLVTYLGHI